MMISPEMYVAQFENATYNEMIKERDGLIRYIRHFEKMEKPVTDLAMNGQYVQHQKSDTRCIWNTYRSFVL